MDALADEPKVTRAPASVTSSAFLFLILLLSPGEAAALEYDLKITTTAHVGVFPDAQNGGQEDVISSLQVKPDLVIQSDNSWEAVLAPRFRLGLNDSEYNFISLDDVYAEYVSDRFEVRAGFQTHFWGAVESFNIVDIFNQNDYRVDFFDRRENKIGQSAVRVRSIFAEDTIDLIFFPYFMRANLPNKVNPYNPFDGRFDFTDDPFYTNTAERLRPQFAVRWERTIGAADLGLAYFNGYMKFPVANVAPGALEADLLYYEMQQIGGDFQMSLGNWLLKAEAMYYDTGIAGSFFVDSVLSDGSIVRRNLVPTNLTAFVGGFEYTFFRVLGESDLGVLAEYLYNSQQNFKGVAFRPFQNDAFTGIRWSRNNLGQGELLGGLIIDLRDGTQLWRVEYSERFFDRVKLLAYFEIINAASGDPLRPFNDADNVAFQLSYVY